MGQILPTVNLHRDHSILYALVYEKEFSHIRKNNGYPDLLCKNMLQGLYSKHVPIIVSVLVKAWSGQVNSWSWYPDQASSKKLKK